MSDGRTQRAVGVSQAIVDVENGRAAEPQRYVIGDPTVVPLFLERRLWAAAADVGIVTLFCLAVFHSFNPYWPGRHPAIWVPAAIGLGLFFLVEMLTGLTPGKWLAGLRIRMKGDGSTPLPRRMLRACARHLPVGVFLCGVPLATVEAHLLIGQLLVVILTGYIPASYLLMWRKGGTLFDTIASTTIASA